MTILDGKKTSSDIKDEITFEVAKMKEEGLKTPHLAAVIVGNDGASRTYVGAKVKACARVGFESTLIELPESITEEELLKEIGNLNMNQDIDGFIVQLPLPKHIDEQKVLMAVDPDKDVDLSIDPAILETGNQVQIDEAREQVKNAASLKAMRISFVMVGLWWLGFAQFTYRKLPNNVFNKKPSKDYLWKGFRELKAVVKEVKNYPTLRNFLIAFFLLSVGVQTIILMASIFGSEELGLEATSLIVTILLIQVVAIFGAWIFSTLSKKYGNFTALKITIFIWIFVCFGAFMLHKDMKNVDLLFYGLGGVLGLVLGAVQSLARSTYSKLLPETEDHATYFSFFDVTEKIAIVLGTFVFGFLFAITGSMQWSALSLALFFVAAFIVLSFLKGTKHVR